MGRAAGRLGYEVGSVGREAMHGAWRGAGPDRVDEDDVIVRPPAIEETEGIGTHLHDPDALPAAAQRIPHEGPRRIVSPMPMPDDRDDEARHAVATPAAR
jgi:hypothetical protein